jgi:hypothetical protein
MMKANKKTLLQGPAQDCWSAYISSTKLKQIMPWHNALFHGQNHYFFFIFHNFAVKINTFLGQVVTFSLSGGRGRPVPTGRGRTLLSTVQAQDWHRLMLAMVLITMICHQIRQHCT